MILLCILTLTIGLTVIHGKEYSRTLSYGEYFYVSKDNMGEAASIQWSFAGSNSLVGIQVWVLDAVNFAIFQVNPLSASGYQLSDGSYYSHSGEFNIPSFDDWTIIFWHNQLIGGSTTLTINVTFTGVGLVGWLLSIIIAAPILLVIAAVVIVVVVLNRRKKQPVAPLPAVQPQVGQPPTSAPPPQQPAPAPPPPVDSVFCWNCGQPNKKPSTFCMKCGKDLTSPEK
ncbi:MAG: zinc ribbon domain-containing protein [Candidatus Heimdallarchaeota archaeon]|nr:zinc ribbon domain-containing protein [Candidatus Heimdallarchaeota archaeon]